MVQTPRSVSVHNTSLSFYNFILILLCIFALLLYDPVYCRREYYNESGRHFCVYLPGNCRIDLDETSQRMERVTSDPIKYSAKSLQGFRKRWPKTFFFPVRNTTPAVGLRPLYRFPPNLAGLRNHCAHESFRSEFLKNFL